MSWINKALSNILWYMLSLLTGGYNKTDERNAEKQLPLETKIGKFFSTFAWGLEAVRDNADLIRLWSDLDNAKGKVLDRKGANFGVARGGASDEFYRLMIRTKLLAQISGGDIETIIAAVAGLYEIDPVNVELYEVFPAKVQIALMESDLPPNLDELRDLIGILTKRLLGQGVGLDMLYIREDRIDTSLYIGGRVVAEFERIRLGNYIEEPVDLIGTLYIGGRVVSELERIRLARPTI